MNTLEIQQALVSHGYDPGPLDGVMGPKTRHAIIQFKTDQGLQSRAYIGPVTKSLLRGNAKPADISDVPRWLKLAGTYRGLKEIRGPKDHPKILRWWDLIGQGGINDDETPWCAAYVGGVLEECGIASTRKGNARSYLQWGRRLEAPEVGCIVIFWRGNKHGWKGHVGFVVGQAKNGNLIVRGGNQNNMVSDAEYSRERVLGYVWPLGEPLAQNGLPIAKATAKAGSET